MKSSPNSIQKILYLHRVLQGSCQALPLNRCDLPFLHINSVKWENMTTNKIEISCSLILYEFTTSVPSMNAAFFNSESEIKVDHEPAKRSICKKIDTCHLVIHYLHRRPFSGAACIVGVTKFGKIGSWRTWLHIIFLTKWNPMLCKVRCFPKGAIGQNRPSIIREVDT